MRIPNKIWLAVFWLLAGTPAFAADVRCTDPLTVIGQLEQARSNAQRTSSHEQAVAKYFRNDGIFLEPGIEQLFSDSQAVVARWRENSSAWQLKSPPETNEAWWNALSSYIQKSSFEGFRNLKYLNERMADWFATPPLHFIADNSDKEYPYRLAVSNENIAQVFLEKLKTTFPPELANRHEDPKESLAQLEQLKAIIAPLGWTESQYYRMAPAVHEFFNETKGSVDTRHAVFKAVAGMGGTILARAAASAELDTAIEEAETALEHFETHHRPRLGELLSTKATRKKRLEDFHGTKIDDAKAKLVEAEMAMRGFGDRLADAGLAGHGDTPTLPAIVGPTASAIESLRHAPEDIAGTSPRFAAARQELAALDKLVEHYFSPGGLFTLPKVVAKKGKYAHPHDYLDFIRSILKPPALEKASDGVYHSQVALQEWDRYLRSLGLTEAQYLKLLADMRVLEEDLIVQNRVLDRLIPEWEHDFKELDALRELAFGKPDPESVSLPNPPPGVPAPVALSARVREPIGIYLDTVVTWSAEFDRVAADALGGEYTHLSAEARKIAGELKSAIRHGKPIDGAAYRRRLLPLTVKVGKQADEQLPKLARLHNEALMIQHGLRTHVDELAKLVKERTSRTAVEIDSLPEWQQDVAYRQLERENSRLTTIEKMSTGYILSVETSRRVEKSAEKMRDNVVELNMFLNRHTGSQAPYTKEEAQALLQLLEGYQ